ncbi:phage tail sheath subtilisin-like domain-containing protein [Rummeliibacillus sp. POC4]|uniref:phage tail sheath subtilisin-like domain-containing protein n=1 Tax=Rummeliibacillus sp. POC4 TaxID=2305899 RepID=UPI000E676074|nr:phage tail sheath subtilisin-like domain-containing protein [Rummeliibacillus sp. POC4]RIJ63605.1 phage tail sheath protein [Rummeliibacillus sp. POC4]
MLGAMFKLGELKPRPGIYVRWYNAGGYARYARPLGVGAQVIQSDWGPVNKVITLNPASDIKSTIGTGKGAEAVTEIFAGGASYVHVVRAGNGGTVGSLQLETTDAKGINLTTKYPTSREFSVTLRDALDPAKKEFLVIEGGRQLESITFAKGGDEVAALKEALGKDIYFNMLTEATGEITNAVNVAAIGGTNPTATGEDYTNAMRLTESKFFDSIGVDTEDPVVHAAVHAFVRRKLQEGFRITTFLGANKNDDFETKVQRAKGFNDFAVAYIGNGFLNSVGEEVLGSRAAARVMGMFISGSYKSSLTKKTIDGALSIVGELAPDQYDTAATSGLLVFSLNSDEIPQIDYGINTLVSIGSDEDEGWKKLRRVRTRYELIDRIVVKFDKAMSNEIDNGPDGQQSLITLANGEIGQMIREGGLASGAMILDPDNAPEGDSAWFKFDNLVDLDGLEKAYLSFGFQY